MNEFSVFLVLFTVLIHIINQPTGSDPFASKHNYCLIHHGFSFTPIPLSSTLLEPPVNDASTNRNRVLSSRSKGKKEKRCFNITTKN